MKKVYHLGRCTTCQRILEELNWDEKTQEIRSEKITEKQLDEMAVFPVLMKHFSAEEQLNTKKMKEKILSEADYKQLILKEDTFLKRPIFSIDGSIFIGNTKKTVEAVQAALYE